MFPYPHSESAILQGTAVVCVWHATEAVQLPWNDVNYAESTLAKTVLSIARPPSCELPGIYIHIPFCSRRCNYCDFTTWAVDAPPAGMTFESYTDALTREVQIVAAQSGIARTIDTLYFGGGTPSLLPLNLLERILGALQANFDLYKLAEFTLEANPETLTAERLAAWRELGVTRLSIGIQSLCDDSLHILGRAYTRNEALARLSQLRSPLSSFELSFDLLLGLPWQPPEQALQDMNELLAFGANHFSLYGLKLEPSTPLGRQAAHNSTLVPEEDRIADEMNAATSLLDERGFIRYEVSNFARAPRFCLHNLKYWLFAPYFGFGLSASGFDGSRRSYNFRDFAAYRDALAQGNPPWADTEELDAPELTFQRLMLALRTVWGVSFADFNEAFAVHLRARAASLTEKYPRLLESDEERLSLTGAGMNVMNSLLLELTEPLPFSSALPPAF